MTVQPECRPISRLSSKKAKNKAKLSGWQKKALNPLGFKAFFWQRVKDSNSKISVSGAPISCRNVLFSRLSAVLKSYLILSKTILF